MTVGIDNSGVEGLVSVRCDLGPKETMDRLVAEIEAQGMTVFAKVDHAALAAQAGLELRPTKLVIFGNPRAGTPLMQAKQTAGIDLPLKMLVWQDAESRTWLSYNEPDWIAQRHGVGAGGDAVAKRMSAALGALVKKATEALAPSQPHEADTRISDSESTHRKVIKKYEND